MYNSQIVVERIKVRVRENGHNMSELNAYCQIDKSTVNMSAQKKYGLSAKILYDAAVFLDCSVDYLLGRTDTPEIGGVHQKITAGRDNYVNSTVNNRFSNDDIDLLHLIQNIPLIERSKLIFELSQKYNVEKEN